MNDDDGAGSVGRRPIRTCVGCRTARPQSDLTRLHLDERRLIAVDRNGRGRGAWICAADFDRCIRTAVDRKALARAFRAEPDRESVERLLESASEPY